VLINGKGGARANADAPWRSVRNQAWNGEERRVNEPGAERTYPGCEPDSLFREAARGAARVARPVQRAGPMVTTMGRDSGRSMGILNRKRFPSRLGTN
jgi:hypothetical protein